jgi:hypothetical protein
MFPMAGLTRFSPFHLLNRSQGFLWEQTYVIFGKQTSSYEKNCLKENPIFAATI